MDKRRITMKIIKFLYRFFRRMINLLFLVGLVIYYIGMVFYYLIFTDELTKSPYGYDL